ncbi:MAG TPA: hypothetical protein VGH73_22325 [Thermoanaerobaculia bacterium]|jgi:DNA-binding protein H-NS
MPRTRIPVTIGEWETLTQAVTPETAAGSPLLEQAHAKLKGFHEELLRLTAERADHEARKQQATLRINQVVDEGRRLATLIRKVLKEDLGIDNEELARFNVQPFRGRKFAKRPARAAKAAKRAAASPKSSQRPET